MEYSRVTTIAQSTYRFDFNFVVFSCRGSRSFSTVYCKYTVRACFNNLKNLSICESGIKFPNIQLRKCESKKTNSRVSATYSKSGWKPRELYLKPNSTTKAIHLLISKMLHMKVSKNFRSPHTTPKIQSVPNGKKELKEKFKRIMLPLSTPGV